MFDLRPGPFVPPEVRTSGEFEKPYRHYYYGEDQCHDDEHYDESNAESLHHRPSGAPLTLLILPMLAIAACLGTLLRFLFRPLLHF